MRLTTLQTGLIIAGVLLVAGVLVYNWWQERRVRRRIEGAFRPQADSSGARSATRGDSRVEPTLGVAASGGHATDGGNAVPDEAPFGVPMDEVGTLDGADTGMQDAVLPPTGPVTRSAMADSMPPQGTQPQPDPGSECVATLQPVRPIVAGACAAGLRACLGKPLRWFGRRDRDAPWQRISGEAPGEFGGVAACLLLADRNGAAGRAQIETFHRLIAEIAPPSA